MYRVIEKEFEKEKIFYIQQRTIFGWLYLLRDDDRKVKNEIYGLYLPLIIIISMICSYFFVITFDVLSLLLLNLDYYLL